MLPDVVLHNLSDDVAGQPLHEVELQQPLVGLVEVRGDGVTLTLVALLESKDVSWTQCLMQINHAIL